MTELLRFLVSVLISPAQVIAIGLILLGIAGYRKHRKTVRILAWGLVTVFFLSYTPFLQRTLVWNLEKRYSPFRLHDYPGLEEALGEGRARILVLGGGHTLDPSLPPTDQLKVTALGRLVEGIRIHQLLPGSELVFSGYSDVGVSSQAEVAREAALSLGIPDSVIHILPEPHNTRAEARSYADRFRDGRPLILVTDALHLPRAMLLFEAEGLNPIPAPTNHRLKSGAVRRWHWAPSSENAFFLESAFHEYIGMLWARLSS